MSPKQTREHKLGNQVRRLLIANGHTMYRWQVGQAGRFTRQAEKITGLKMPRKRPL